MPKTPSRARQVFEEMVGEADPVAHIRSFHDQVDLASLATRGVSLRQRLRLRHVTGPGDWYPRVPPARSDSDFRR
jgi:hypothetical protein